MGTFLTSRTGKDARKTILYFYLHYGAVGPEYNEYEYRFLEALCKTHEVLVAFFTKSRQDNAEGIAPEEATLLPLQDLPCTKQFPAVIRWPVETISRVLRVALLARILRPDIVMANWITRSSGLYCAIARVHPLLEVVWGSDILVEAKKSRILRAFGRFTIRAADAVIVDSEVQRKAAINLNCNPSKIYSFPWGIDLERFRAGKPTMMRNELGWLKDKIVVSTRWQAEIYDVESLIRAIPLILNRTKDAKFLIVGGGPLLEYHKDLARELGITDKVRFLGTVANETLPEILNSADVYVSTSHSDGTSASLMEAIACGLAVVVTNIPGNREWVTQGENGFLVRPGDSLSLADGVAGILEDDELRVRMRTANVKLAKERADWNVELASTAKVHFGLASLAHSHFYRRREIMTLKLGVDRMRGVITVMLMILVVLASLSTINSQPSRTLLKVYEERAMIYSDDFEGYTDNGRTSNIGVNGVDPTVPWPPLNWPLGQIFIADGRIYEQTRLAWGPPRVHASNYTAYGAAGGNGTASGCNPNVERCAYWINTPVSPNAIMALSTDEAYSGTYSLELGQGDTYNKVALSFQVVPSLFPSSSIISEKFAIWLSLGAYNGGPSEREQLLLDGAHGRIEYNFNSGDWQYSDYGDAPFGYYDFPNGTYRLTAQTWHVIDIRSNLATGYYDSILIDSVNQFGNISSAPIYARGLGHFAFFIDGKFDRFTSVYSAGLTNGVYYYLDDITISSISPTAPVPELPFGQPILIATVFAATILLIALIAFRRHPHRRIQNALSVRSI